MLNTKNKIYIRLSFLFFCSGLRDRISCSLLVGIIPTQNSGYTITRLWHNALFHYVVSQPVWPTMPRGRHSLRSIPLHLNHSPHWMCFSPPLPLPAPPLPLPPIPTLNPSLSLGPPPPVLSPSSDWCPSAPTTSGTPLPPPSAWSVHRGPESVASQHKVMENQCQHLTMTQRNELLRLLQKFKELFYGTLGTWKRDIIYFELKEDAKPISPWPYPVPKVHKEMFKNEVECLVLLGGLEVANDPEWGAPSFDQPRHKSKLVRFLSNFRNLNKQLKQKPHFMPKINEDLLKWEDFQYDTSIDLNMGYYHIRLSKNASNLCTIITTWGEYRYKSLTMGVAN